ncbi:family 20 glycosylhydrolase [Bacteroides salyersiae]|jgi:beta-N-acetylhexosaminidase|uniref:glycoside hydrolase family 20 protein n=1 Tax=Bacteroides salyersiae TaxID=291644 RepID=UPI00125DA7DB|nr:family 20 glycosylhydrolase [Bacteroides salyersiae]KAB5350502.1 family 20 glycosylhydrolase [Bacteroides salyersiae]KAB5355319.1 family 20 glycosylhydrolase [Bacteroides salyersiae]KAB5358535.1 family 20 glycosylhydrolase [Bacteroides salyersiae]KAB5369784.1 family 20 glycosylhydrolase [Bacteroides salyersiae]KAB5376764.1 family 20 glycosylhydrolase [Bacteroides salyersiae]
MRKGIISCLLFISFWLAGCQQRKEVEVQIIPQPQSSELSSGTYGLPRQAVFSTNLPEEDKKEFTEYLQASPFALQPEAEGTQKSVVSFTIIAPVSDQESMESYQLSITGKGISVVAPSAAGLFYGFQSLLQLAEQEADGTFSFPLIEIKDSPRFSYRGLHLDVSRHFRTKEFLKKQLDAMARYKLNRFHWHLTDGAGWRLEIKRYPELTEQAAYRPYPNWKAWWKGGRKYCTKDAPGADGGYYTQEDAREIVEYARQRHITVIPEIEMPGHSEEVLAVFPHLSCSGKPYVNSEVCIGNEDTFTFLQNVLLEVMEIFPSEYIHIGGDEANMDSWRKCPLCQKRMKQEGLADVKELQSYLIHRMEKFLNEHGRQLLGWDEILEGGLAPRATVMSWRGEEGGIKAAKAGHDVIMTPGGFCYLDSYQDAPTTQPEAIGGYLTLEKVYFYDPIPEVLTKEGADYIQGVQANVWAEYITTAEHMEYMVYPRLLALAEVAWTQPDKKNWEHFHRCALKEVKWLQDNGYHPFDLSKEVGERPEAAIPVEHLGLMKTVKYTSPYAPQYTAGGDSALVDGLRGGWTYGDKRWQGFLNTDMDITVDLGEMKEISSIAAEFMQLSGPYVWLPREVIISISEDGNTFTEQARLHTDVPTTEDRLVFRTYEWDGKASARYVRYQALSNGIEGGWLFTDEIVIK